jgi:diguanylate cyclase (GGDEF)-like protein
VEIVNDKNEVTHTVVESALFHITECAVNTRSIKEYAAKLHHIIAGLMYAKNFFIVLYDQDRSLLDFIYIVDENEDDKYIIESLSEDDLRRTLTGYMLNSGKMQHLSAEDSQALEEKDLVDSVGELHSDWLGVPLIYNDEVLGGLVIQSYCDDIHYGTSEEELLQFVARQIALVFKSKQAEMALIDSNLELERRVKNRTEELKKINEELAIEIVERKRKEKVQFALFKITDLVSTTHDLDDFFKNVHKVIASLMYAENEYVALISDDQKYLEFVYHVDKKDSFPEKRLINEKNKKAGLSEKILFSGKGILLNRKLDSNSAYIGADSVSYLGVPLKENDKTIGLIAVQSYEKGFNYTQFDQEILTTIGKQVATAILRKKDADSLKTAHEGLEVRVKERTVELEETIEKRKLVEKKLEHDSLHDALTGLPNRLHFSNRLNEVLKEQAPSDDAVLGLLFLDLDRFKLINDSLGHHVGDLFLIEVSRRLKSCIRTDDLVARLGGDEFCILMPNIQKESAAFRLCGRILKELKKPVVVAGNSLMTSASIGVRLASHSEESAELIMSDADAAMYQAKHQGKNRFCVFDAEIKKLVTGRMKMERDLRDAIDNDELFLVYQPLVNFRTNKVVGFEALVRWMHPEDGLISPTEFIPVAEETGLIVDIGELVIDMTCKTLSEFKDSPILKGLYLNVNVSSVQILSRTLDDFIRDKLSGYKLNSNRLNIEITESILIDDYKAALSFVRELKSMGIKIYLDDFGTGFSSLSYLHKFPFDAIKLDRSFITALDESKNNKAIVDSIAQLAKNLNIHIVAEGIETKHQLETIEKMDYEVVQGYYYSKPIKYDEITPYLENWK